MTANTTIDVRSQLIANAKARVAKVQRAKDGKAKAAERAQREYDTKLAKYTAMRDTRNPQLLPDTLRRTEPGELIGASEAKGWAISIRCECCSAIREVNVQDAFQCKFCLDCRDEARKAAAKARRAGKVQGEFANHTAAELDDEIENLRAELVEAGMDEDEIEQLLAS
jgi:hypothetical protein